MNLEKSAAEGALCRVLIKNDYPQVIDLMAKSKIPFAGLYSKAIYRAIYREALVDKKIMFVVAEHKKKLIGLVIAIINWKVFWVSFLLKHPILACQIVYNKLKKKMLHSAPKNEKPHITIEQMNEIRQYLTDSIKDRSWDDTSPEIAKAIFISVDPEYRRSGIGLKLNKYRDKVLIERGVKRYDGWVQAHRIPQLHLLHKTGFFIEKRGNSFFVSKDL